MRIGEVNKDNYKFFLQMLGAKSNKALDALFGEDEKKKGISPQKASKHVEDDTLYISSDDVEKYRKIVSVSDDVKDKIISTVRKQFLQNGNGMTKGGGIDGMEFGAIIDKYIKSNRIPKNERFAVEYTLGQIQVNEAQRLVDYVKKMDPMWDFGKKFDKNILIKSDFGTNTVDVKA